MENIEAESEHEQLENSPRPSSTASESKEETTTSDKESETTDTTNTKEADDDKSDRPQTPVENMEMDDKEKRVAESPVSVSAASDISSSSRPNKRKRKGTAPTRHVQQSDGEQKENNSTADPTEEDANSEGEFGSAYNEIDRANNRKLLEEFETKSDVIEPTSRPVSVAQSGTSRQATRPQKYGPPRLDLFGPPQHYLDLFGPPVRESTDNCSVVIRGIGEEEIYCGPGDKDPGDMMIPLRTNF